MTKSAAPKTPLQIATEALESIAAAEWRGPRLPLKERAAIALNEIRALTPEPAGADPTPIGESASTAPRFEPVKDPLGGWHMRDNADGDLIFVGDASHARNGAKYFAAKCNELAADRLHDEIDTPPAVVANPYCNPDTACLTGTDGIERTNARTETPAPVDGSAAALRQNIAALMNNYGWAEKEIQDEVDYAIDHRENIIEYLADTPPAEDAIPISPNLSKDLESDPADVAPVEDYCPDCGDPLQMVGTDGYCRNDDCPTIDRDENKDPAPVDVGEGVAEVMRGRAAAMAGFKCVCGHKPEFCHVLNAAKWCGATTPASPDLVAAARALDNAFNEDPPAIDENRMWRELHADLAAALQNTPQPVSAAPTGTIFELDLFREKLERLATAEGNRVTDSESPRVEGLLDDLAAELKTLIDNVQAQYCKAQHVSGDVIAAVQSLLEAADELDDFKQPREGDWWTVRERRVARLRNSAFDVRRALQSQPGGKNDG